MPTAEKCSVLGLGEAIGNDTGGGGASCLNVDDRGAGGADAFIAMLGLGVVNTGQLFHHRLIALAPEYRQRGFAVTDWGTNSASPRTA